MHMNPGNIMILGDSYSTYEGHIPEGYSVYYSGHRTAEPDVSDVKYTWWGRLIAETGANLIQNNSWSGSTIGYTGYNNADCSRSSSFIYRIETLYKEKFFDKNRIDTLFIFGGTNDSWSNAPLGELKFNDITESDLFCVLPAICYITKRMKQLLPSMKIIVIGNCDIKPEITNALQQCCEQYGLIYTGLSGIDKISGHPTELGMEQICKQILASMQ